MRNKIVRFYRDTVGESNRKNVIEMNYGSLARMTVSASYLHWIVILFDLRTIFAFGFAATFRAPAALYLPTTFVCFEQIGASSP